MNLIMRYLFSAVFFSLFLTVAVVGVTLVAFPLDDWSILWTKKILNLPFILYAISVPVFAGGIIGITTGVFWRQRLKQLDRQLDTLIKGQKLTGEWENYKELEDIQNHIDQLEVKLREQMEYSQRLVSERATEREKSLQEIVVQERSRLARELHDSVSQQLFAASMMMSAINEANPSEASTLQRQLKMVEKMIHQSQLEMRALLLHLRPVALKGKSLQEGVKELLIELTQKVPIKIDWNVESFKTDKGIEDHVFRILQESVSNTLRHAKATSLYVLLIERDDTIILRIVDDGIGFMTDEIRASAYGLTNMRERAHEVGGTFKIVSLPNEGTRIEVKIPNLHKEGEAHD